MNYGIRGIQARDVITAIAIERESYDATHAWTARDFHQMLNRQDVKGIVALNAWECVVGYMIYSYSRINFTVCNIAVAPEWRRAGVGSQLIEQLKSCLATRRQKSVFVRVRESNVGMQLFLKANGFRAITTQPEFYTDGQDGYVFRYNVLDSATVAQ